MDSTTKKTDLLGYTINDRPTDNNYGFTQSQKKAFDAMIAGQNLFICGPAGTGKSYLIDCFADYCYKKGKALITCAPTGMAAREINGETCHMAFSLDIGPLLADKKLGRPVKNLMEAEVILIDEISMLRIDAFDTIIRKVQQANRLRKRDVEKYLNGSDEERQKIKDSKWKLNPVQIILVGDFFQLPPVLTPKDRAVLESNKGYGCKLKNGYAFQSDYWHSYGGGFRTIRLTEIVRQKQDKQFAQALNQLRRGELEGADYIFARVSDHPVMDGIWLYGTRKDVARENSRRLSELPGKEKMYKMKISEKDEFGDSELVADRELVLKAGARVMSLINDPYGERYVNGSLGTVQKLLKDIVVVQFDNGIKINVERHRWDVYGYEVTDDKLKQMLKGSYEQFPLKLAYAITIHKSQGQTFDKVNISTQSFAPGQLYVGLSRVKTAENMYIEGKIDGTNLFADEEVLRFNRHPVEYRYFDHRGGARPNAGRKPKTEGRGPTKPIRIPVKYKDCIDKCMSELDKVDDDKIVSVKPVLVPAEYVDYIKDVIAQLNNDSSVSD